MSSVEVLQCNVSEMIDLALGTPEVGCVDFNMLQNVLHILAYRLDLKRTHVEVRTEGVMVPPVQPTQTVEVSEYYRAQNDEEESEHSEIEGEEQSPKDDSFFVVERVKKPPKETTEYMKVTKGTSMTTLASSRKTKMTEHSVPGQGQGFDTARLDHIEEELESLQGALVLIAKECGLSEEDIMAAMAEASTKAHSHHGGGTAEHGTDKSHSVKTHEGEGHKRGKHHEQAEPEPEWAEPEATAENLTPLSLFKRINDIDKRLRECCKKIHKVDSDVSNQLSSFQDQMTGLADDLGRASMELSSSVKLDDIKDFASMVEAFGHLQHQVHHVGETLRHLTHEKDDREQYFQDIQEQLELLKTIKLDREDLFSIMAQKADMSQLARKVSHEQFDMVYEDISKALTDTVAKLDTQEEMFQQAFDDVQRDVENKLDRLELVPLKDFFLNKFRMLQDNLKKMAALRREAEAAGATKKLMKDLNCLSCDADVVMNKDAGPQVPEEGPLHVQHSMKPYLSYELDQVRKQRAGGAKPRSMRDWETMEGQMKKPVKVRSATDKHLCNRYCGGSHTVTTPAQRVTRLGHFLRQWGPECFPIGQSVSASGDGKTTKPAAEQKEGADKRPHSPPIKLQKRNAECTCAEF